MWPRVLLMLLGMSLCLFASHAFAAIYVVGNPDISITHLSLKQLKTLYLSKPLALPTGEQLLPFDEASSSPLYQHFYQSLLGWSGTEVNGYRSLLQNDAVQPPEQLSSRVNLATLIRDTPESVVYVDSATRSRLGNRVKVLYKINTSVDDEERDFVEQSHLQNDGASLTSRAMDTVTKATDLSVQQEVAALNASLPNGIRMQGSMQSDVWVALVKQFKLGHYSKDRQVQQSVSWFLAHRSVLNRMLLHAQPYLAYVENQVAERGMPGEFALLPMVESGYDPFAYSSAGATGLWQLMPGTAASAGLAFNWWYDARRDIPVSTQAALDYLVGLNRQFHSWLLAAAAYNTGAGHVRSAVQRNRRAGQPTDFWNLQLPEETRAYVPKLLALATIIRHPDRYDVQLPSISTKTYFVGIPLAAQLDIEKAAHLAQTNISEMRRLNPGIRHWATNPLGNATLYVPAEQQKLFYRNLHRTAKKTRVSWAYHEVQMGETLSKIAHNYHTSTALLRKVNGLSGGAISSHQGLVVPLYLRKTYSDLLAGDVPRQLELPVLAEKHASQSLALPASSAPSQASSIPLSLDAEPKHQGSSFKVMLQQIYH